jgi:hypothetical protein
MGEELKWLIGIGVTIILAGFATLSTAFYRLANEMRSEDRTLHERVNKVRQDYVRRDDNEKNFAALEKKLDDMAARQEEQTRAVLAALTARRD